MHKLLNNQPNIIQYDNKPTMKDNIIKITKELYNKKKRHFGRTRQPTQNNKTRKRILNGITCPDPSEKPVTEKKIVAQSLAREWEATVNTEQKAQN